DATRDNLRRAFDFGKSSWSFETVATRGDHLALVRRTWRGVGQRFKDSEIAFNDSEIVFLDVIQADDDERLVCDIGFDADDFATAYEELDGRFASLEAATASAVWETIRAFWRRVPTHDVDALVELAAPGFVFEDHRPRGFGTLTVHDYRGMLSDLFA